MRAACAWTKVGCAQARLRLFGHAETIEDQRRVIDDAMHELILAKQILAGAKPLPESPHKEANHG